MILGDKQIDDECVTITARYYRYLTAAGGDARLVEPSYSDADKIPDDTTAKRATRKKKKLIPPPLEAIPGLVVFILAGLLLTVVSGGNIAAGS